MSGETNKRLVEAVGSKEFRADLFYRLNVVRVEIPPLRARREEIHLLVNYFLTKFAPQQKHAPKSIASGAIPALGEYQCPGKGGELESVVRRAPAVAQGGVMFVGDVRPGSVSPDAAWGGQ